MKRVIFTVAAFVLCANLLNSASGQTGAWIGQSFTGFGSGSRIYKAGGNCAAYTYENASKILFFDINSSAWTEANFGSTQHFYSILEGGNLIFGYTDSLIIVYNGITSNFDTIRFVGTPLHLQSTPEISRSYQCGENLAIFVTDERFYIFDVNIDHWQEYDYVLPTDYSGVGYYWVQDDCAGILLYRFLQQPPTTLAYSSHLQAFAETPRGMAWGGQDAMSNGFAGLYNWVPETDQYVVGYSSLTNEFLHVDIPSDYTLEGCVTMWDLDFDLNTVWEATARKLITPFEDVRYNVNCYDTRRAAWSNQVYDFDPTHNPGFGGWFRGGRFAWTSTNTDDEYRAFYIYSGYTGSIFTLQTPLETAYLTQAFFNGSNVCASNDTNDYYAYNVETNQGILIPLTGMDTRHIGGGEGYLTFNKYDITDQSITYYYHGESNSYRSIELTNTYSSGFASGAHVSATITISDNAGVTFYSPVSNQLQSVSFTPDALISLRVTDYIAVASATGRTVIFDTHYGNIREFDCSVGNYGTGENIVIAANSGANSLSGYSSLTNTITTTNLASSPNISGAGDFIGLGYIGYNGTSYYAFNGYYANWVELIPEGSYIGQNPGDKTAIVVRSNHVYAFDPQAPEDAIGDESDISLPGLLSILPNYPNPFNNSTLIGFRTGKTAEVHIEIFDILGRKVAGEFYANLKKGYHEYLWSAPVQSSGVYFCTIRADIAQKTIKMLLVK